jgi:hypothetical protein
VQQEAKGLLELIDCEEEPFIPSDDASLSAFLHGNFEHIKALLAAPSLDKEEYHDLKKLARETGTLFMYMAEAVKCKGRGYHVYRSCSEGFFQINDLLAQTDYEPEEGDHERVKVPKKVVNMLIKYISRIGIAPYRFDYTLDDKEMFWMVNTAKSMYSISSRIRESIDEDYEGLQRLFKTLVRDIERARNILILLDISHKAPEEYEPFLQATNTMCSLLEKEDYETFKSLASDYKDLAYYTPSKGLQNWTPTDQESFESTLQACLQTINALQKGATISQQQVEAIKREVQSIYDFAHLSRRNGLFRRGVPGLPTCCFDKLEEVSGALFQQLDTGNSNIEVTEEMAWLAHFITSRLGCRK